MATFKREKKRDYLNLDNVRVDPKLTLFKICKS